MLKRIGNFLDGRIGLATCNRFNCDCASEGSLSIDRTSGRFFKELKVLVLSKSVASGLS